MVIDLVDSGSSQNAAESVSPVNPPSEAEPAAVRLRVGQHPSFDRLVFEWPRDVSYRIVGTAPNPTIAFSAPGRLDTKRLRGRSLDRIASLEAARDSGGLTVGLRVPENATLRHYRAGGQVVVDVVDPETGGKKDEPRSVAQNDVPPETSVGNQVAEAMQPERESAGTPGTDEPASRTKPSITERVAVGKPRGLPRGRVTRHEKAPSSDPVAEPVGVESEKEAPARPDSRETAAAAEHLLDGLVPLVTMAGPDGEVSSSSNSAMPSAEPPKTPPGGPGMETSKDGTAGSMGSGDGAQPEAPEATPAKDMVLDLNSPLELLPEDLAGMWRDQLAEPPKTQGAAPAGPMPQLDLPDELSELTQDGLPSSRLVVAPEVPEAAKPAATVTADAVEPEELEDDWVPIPGRNLRPRAGGGAGLQLVGPDRIGGIPTRVLSVVCL